MQTATIINGTDSDNPYFVQLQRDGGWPLSSVYWCRAFAIGCCCCCCCRSRGGVLADV